MGRTDVAKRPMSAAARALSGPYAASYDQVASPISLHFPAGVTGPSGGGAPQMQLGRSDSSSDSPPYDHRVRARPLTPNNQPTTASLAQIEDLPEGTYALEPDEFGSYPGFPSVGEYEEIQEAYLRNLSSRKQEKALISQAMYDSIHAVLMDPTNTTYGTPQFRFWVRKMFVLASFQGEYTVTHEEKPVAAKEQIYQILVHCHGECYHGGRDKTCSQIKQYYSWIPKELVAQFVKACPTCVLKRSNNPKKFVAMLKDIGGAQGADDDYIDYFTSPTKNRALPGRPAPMSSGRPPAALARSVSSSSHPYAKRDMPENARRPIPPPLNLDDPYSMQQHHQNQQVYTPGILEDMSTSSSTTSSQPFSRRPSSSSIANIGTSGSSSQVHTPLSAAFPYGSSGGMEEQGWPGPSASSQGQFAGAAMSRQGGRTSVDEGSYGRQQRHLMAPSMGYSLSEGNLPTSSTSSNGDLTFCPPPPVPSRYRSTVTGNVFQHQAVDTSFAMSGSDRQHHDIASDGSLIVDNDGHQQNIYVKVEDHAEITHTAEDDIALLEHFTNGSEHHLHHLQQHSQSALSNGPAFGRRRNAAPAPLNLNLAGSNFVEYRGPEGLLSAHTPASGVPSQFRSPMDGEFFPHIHQAMHAPQPIRSASLFGPGGMPSSAVAAQFPELSLGSAGGPRRALLRSTSGSMVATMGMAMVATETSFNGAGGRVMGGHAEEFEEEDHGDRRAEEVCYDEEPHQMHQDEDAAAVVPQENVAATEGEGDAVMEASTSETTSATITNEGLGYTF